MWENLRMEVELCNKCILCKSRKNTILGKGNKNAKILFILESISEIEDDKNNLLVDENGKFFNKFFEHSKLNMNECYFTSLTKCSSRGELIESKNIKKCMEYLIGQIALINPIYIVTVGEISTKKILNTKEDIHKLVGNVYDYSGGIKVVPIYDMDYLIKTPVTFRKRVLKIFEKLAKELKEYKI